MTGAGRGPEPVSLFTATATARPTNTVSHNAPFNTTNHDCATGLILPSLLGLALALPYLDPAAPQRPAMRADSPGRAPDTSISAPRLRAPAAGPHHMLRELDASLTLEFHNRFPPPTRPVR